MIKKTLLLFFLTCQIHLSALTPDVNTLQQEFHNNVTFATICPDKNCYQLEDNEKLLKKIEKIYVSYKYWDALKAKIIEHKKLLTHSQFITAIDLSRQLLIVALWEQEREDFNFIGSDLISSGNMEREATVSTGEDHYLKTPTGIFKVQSGWRSDGKTLQDNFTLPYGQKGRFIYYFGKQKSVRYNTFDRNGTKIEDKREWQLIEGTLEFAIHAHKSSTTLGRPFSHGCVRMSNELNIFLDTNLVLHKNAFDDQKQWSMKYIEAPTYDKNSTFAGEYLFIFDEIVKEIKEVTR